MGNQNKRVHVASGLLCFEGKLFLGKTSTSNLEKLDRFYFFSMSVRELSLFLRLLTIRFAFTGYFTSSDNLRNHKQWENVSSALQ